MNLATIYDIVKNEPVAMLCVDHNKGDIAYYSNNDKLLDCLDIITNGPLYFSIKKDLKGNILITKERVDLFDSYYLVAINYNLPQPWRITEVKPVDGDDVEEVLNDYSHKLIGDDKGNEEQIKESN